MLKSASLAIAMTLAARRRLRPLIGKRQPMDQSLETKQAERSVALDGATLQRLSAGAHLGSDIISAMPHSSWPLWPARTSGSAWRQLTHGRGRKPICPGRRSRTISVLKQRHRKVRSSVNAWGPGRMKVSCWTAAVNRVRETAVRCT